MLIRRKTNLAKVAVMDEEVVAYVCADHPVAINNCEGTNTTKNEVLEGFCASWSTVKQGYGTLLQTGLAVWAPDPDLSIVSFGIAGRDHCNCFCEGSVLQ